jgi:hypothetical protein
MIHSLAGGGDNNKGGYIALLHPYELASRQPEFIAQHSVLAFLGKKICHFIHDFHPDWIARLCLPPSNGQHDQLIPTIQTRILRRIQNLQSRSRKGAITLFSRLDIGRVSACPGQSRPGPGAQSRGGRGSEVRSPARRMSSSRTSGYTCYFTSFQNEIREHLSILLIKSAHCAQLMHTVHTQWRGVVYMLLPASDCSALWLPGWPAETG